MGAFRGTTRGEWCGAGWRAVLLTLRPLDNRTTDLREDEPFLNSVSALSTSVPLRLNRRTKSTWHPSRPYSPRITEPPATGHSTRTGFASRPLFAEGALTPDRSDDLLLPTRFSQLIDLPPRRSPHIIQVISWNDHGESHAIAPVLGAEPGSQAWTEGMPHEAFREMVRYFANIWRSGGKEVMQDEVKIWGWYRTHPAQLAAEEDGVGRPDHSDWVRQTS